MFILDRRTFLHATGATGLTAIGATVLPTAARAAPSDSRVYTADAMGGNVDSVVIMGDDTAVLIDTQLNADHATRLADMIDATGRTLDTVFISHAHPDHYNGLPTIRARFPSVRAVTHPLIQPLIPEDAAGPVEALNTDHILLEGERLEVLDPMHGDTDLISAVHIPVLDTLVVADIAYVDTHVWVRENTTPERLDMWRATLDRLEAMGVTTIIPGHRAETSANNASVFAYTRGYLDMWQQAVAEATDANDLRARMMDGREDLGLGFAVDMAVATVFPN